LLSLSLRTADGNIDVSKIRMASPWADPRTGRLYLRRQIPVPLRSAFGGRAIYKKALGTKVADEARVAFARENAALEERFAVARRALADGHGSVDPVGLLRRWFSGPAIDGGLDGAQRLLLAFMRLDTEASEWMGDEFVRPENRVAPSDTDWESLARDRDLFDQMLCDFYRGDPLRIGFAWESMRMDDSLTDLCHGFVTAALVPWLKAFDLQAEDHTDRALADAILARLDVDRSGKLADIIKRDTKPSERKRISRLRPTMRMRELFREWKAGNAPRPQTALEYEAAVDDFIEFAGDPAVAAIDADLLYDYRDAAAKLPASMPRADRALPFTERVALHENREPKVSAATLKKRVGGVQALLTYGFQQRWIATNIGSGVQIVGYTKTQRNRRTFEDHELAALFAAPLFTDRMRWGEGGERAVNETLFWVFLIGLTSGARLEEVGQATIADLREDGDLVYLDIGDGAPDEDGEAKHVKTADSVRLVPIHTKLIELGFLAYRDAMLDGGHANLFPALKASDLGKRTKELSRLANRLIDRHVAADSRLVFHSLRHTFKAKGHDAGLSDRTLDQLCGHAPITAGGRYGSAPRIRTIARELHQIDFGCIDWNRIVAVGEETRRRAT
jgi:integrase